MRDFIRNRTEKLNEYYCDDTIGKCITKSPIPVPRPYPKLSDRVYKNMERAILKLPGSYRKTIKEGIWRNKIRPWADILLKETMIDNKLKPDSKTDEEVTGGVCERLATIMDDSTTFQDFLMNISIEITKIRKRNEEKEEERKADIMKKLAEARATKADKMREELLKDEPVPLTKSEKAKLAREKFKEKKALLKAPVELPGGGGEATAELAGGAGTADIHIELAEEPVTVSVSVENQLAVDIATMAMRIRKNTASLDDLTSIISRVASIKLDAEIEERITDPLGHIKDKIVSLYKKDYLGIAEIISRTASSKIQKGFKFEDVVEGKEIDEIYYHGKSSIFQGGMLSKNSSNHNIGDKRNVDDTYFLKDATLYDLSNERTEIELKCYTGTSMDDIWIPIDKFTANIHFTPYFSIVAGKFKLYNIWSDECGGWINSTNNRDVLFVIAYNDGTCYYNFTEDLTIQGSIKKGKKLIPVIDSSKGIPLYRLLQSNIKYPTASKTLFGKNKMSVHIPHEKLNQCYIKKS
jgi:hypothetical protein